MKRLLFLISMIITCASYSNADEIVVPDIVIPKGSTATLDIQLNNNQQIRTEVQFLITLPEGITLVHKSSKLGERFNGMAVAPGDVSEGNNQWTVMISAAGATNDPIPEKSGTLVTVDLLADDSIEEGTELNGCLEVTDMNLASGGSIVGDIQSLVNFKITIGQPDDGRLKFYETSTTLPPYTAGEKANVTMHRTIKANQWSTICLPFNLTKDQIDEVFGSNAKFATWSKWEVVYEDDNETPKAISIDFTELSDRTLSRQGIVAGKPYLIKTQKDIESFELDGVVLGSTTPTEQSMFDSEPYYNGVLYGTFVKKTVPDNGLFISNNQFWYSTGKTSIKAFRCWFELEAVLNHSEAESRISMNFLDDNSSNINEINSRDSETGYPVYDIMGRKVYSQLKKGLYIENRKKKIVK